MKNIQDLKVIFMGTPSFAERMIVSLIKNNYNLTSVFTRPDKKVGRNQEIKKSPVKILAEKNDLKIFQPEKLNDLIVEEIQNQKPDLIVVAAYGKIIPESILKIPKFGCINVHPSLLPKFRGPSPIQNALLSGEKETGTTIMLMDKGMDTGDILSQKTITIKESETFPELSEKLVELSSELLLKTLPLWINKKIEARKQDDSKASLCQLIERNDGKIIWTEDAEVIFNKFRALYPWPGIFTFWEKDKSLKRIKLNKIGMLRNNPVVNHHIGEVFFIANKIGVQTQNGVIILEEIQIEGKPNVKILDFINGYPDFFGSILK